MGPTVQFVTHSEIGTAHIEVSPAFYRLPIERQTIVWDAAHRLAWQEGWQAPMPDDDLVIRDDDGTESWLLHRRRNGDGEWANS